MAVRPRETGNRPLAEIGERVENGNRPLAEIGERAKPGNDPSPKSASA